jgi:hypothetical protein
MNLALTRVSTVGARFDALVVGRLGEEVVGIDTTSGAFVRVAGELDEAVRPYDVVRVEVGGDETLCSPYAPEAIEAAGALRRVGRLDRRRAERLMRPLVDPIVDHLLGFAGPGRPWWTLEADRPSVALITPSVGPMVQGDGHDFRCRFAWGGRVQELPLADRSVAAELQRRGWWQAGPEDLGRMIGGKPYRLVVALGPPRDGHCYKVVASVLTRP